MSEYQLNHAEIADQLMSILQTDNITNLWKLDALRKAISDEQKLANKYQEKINY